ncbi:hypothetical protein [Marinimicrobium alkaliphilum]|uniref:hypothetical protein n=1 Tax=Marinimicrobium alkaliphilum TaxID=2202654 RepID=UPI001300786D|nr:hypothetical protein [Marinimicrobium alkaliphilum]
MLSFANRAVGALFLIVVLSACGGNSDNNPLPDNGNNQSSSSLPDESGNSSSSSSSSSSSESSASSDSSHSSDSSQSSDSSSSSSSEPEPEPDVTTPDAFSFPTVDDVPPGTEVESESATITGITVPVAVSVDQGEYAIDGGEFTTEPGEIASGQSLTLRTQAPDSANGIREVTVSVGEGGATFVVRTPVDDVPPEVAIVFPTPTTATHAETLTVRGTAHDEMSPIASVTLYVENDGGVETYEAGSENGFEVWTAEVTLAPGLNTVSLIAADDHGNETSLEQSPVVKVHQQAFGVPFPDNALAIGERFEQMTYDPASERVFVSGMRGTHNEVPSYGFVTAIDVSTGKRSEFVGPRPPEAEYWPLSITALGVDSARNRLLMGEGGALEGVYAVDLDKGELSLFMEGGTGENSLSRATSFAFSRDDPETGYLALMFDSRVLQVDLNTGARSVVLERDVDKEPIFSSPVSIVLDPSDEGSAYVATDQDRNSLRRVDLATGDSQIVSFEGYPHSYLDVAWLEDIVISEAEGTLYVGTNYIGPVPEGMHRFDPASGQWTRFLTFEEDVWEHWRSARMELLDEAGIIYLALIHQESFPTRDLTFGLFAVDMTTKEIVTISKSFFPID